DLGVATSAIQFSRNVGSTVGVALLGTIMTGSLRHQLPRHLPAPLPPEAAQLTERLLSGEGVSVLFDPARTVSLPPTVEEGIRAALAASFKPVFAACMVFVAVTFVATLLLKAGPLVGS